MFAKLKTQLNKQVAKKKHIQDVGYTDIPVSFGRDGGFICTHRVPWSRGVAAFDAHASRYEAMNVV